MNIIFCLQELSFGDFGDLSPEENERIFHILHGQKNFPVRVEVSGAPVVKLVICKLSSAPKIPKKCKNVNLFSLAIIPPPPKKKKNPKGILKMP